MPKRLPDRFRPDSIAEFTAASRRRSTEAIALEAAGCKTGAIYLWGYVAEMTLKAAFFRASGLPPSQAITKGDLKTALQALPGSNKYPPLHHLGLWADALTSLRAKTPNLAYPDPTFGSLVVAKGYTLYGIWRETIRYHKNQAYPHEMKRARDAAEWLFIHSSDL